MAEFTLDNFQTQVFRKGLAENNKFEMIIQPPTGVTYNSDSSLVSMMCEISNFPPLNVMVRTMNLYGPVHQRPVAMDYGGDGLAASFYLDRDMLVKGFFDRWMTSIVFHDTQNVAYQSEYTSMIYIRQLSDGVGGLQAERTFNPAGVTEEPTYRVKLLEAFPRSMNLVDLNAGAQNQVSRLTVVFAFRKWTYEGQITSTADNLSKIGNQYRNTVNYWEQ